MIILLIFDIATKSPNSVFNLNFCKTYNQYQQITSKNRSKILIIANYCGLLGSTTTTFAEEVAFPPAAGPRPARSLFHNSLWDHDDFSLNTSSSFASLKSSQVGLKFFETSASTLTEQVAASDAKLLVRQDVVARMVFLVFAFSKMLVLPIR